MVNSVFAFYVVLRQNDPMDDHADMTGIEVDPERLLSLAHVPFAVRPALMTVWQLDARLASVLATTSDPAIGMIRLAWWRDALRRLDSTAPPAEPLLQAVAERVLPILSGADLAGLAESWGAVLEDAPGDLAGWQARGRTLFRLAAGILGGAGETAASIGAGWGLVDLAHGTRDAALRQAALRAAAGVLADWNGRTPRSLRALGMLGMLARIDAGRADGVLQQRGAPGRIARMLRYRLIGR